MTRGNSLPETTLEVNASKRDFWKSSEKGTPHAATRRKSLPETALEVNGSERDFW